MQYIAFRNLIGVSHTEEEARALAEEVFIDFVALILILGLFLVKRITPPIFH